MNRDETVVLFSQGREAWNAWAEKMLAERKALEEGGRWRREKNDWMARASADFSEAALFAEVRGIDFGDFVFPGTAKFGRTFFSPWSSLMVPLF